MDLKMEIGHAIIRSYKRLGYKTWYALAEFIDNATQNYFDHRAILDSTADAKTPPLEIRIDYGEEFLRIYDGAMGMDEEDLRRALSIGVPPSNVNGRSEYGLGLKTAACWFGDKWSITTKKFGSTKEYKVSIDVEAVADGKTSLRTETQDNRSPDDHYTLIEVTSLHRHIHHKTRDRLKAYIRSMYRVDLRKGDLWITINDTNPIEPEPAPDLLQSREGVQYREEFKTTINNKPVSGWLGILDTGGRSKAGIAIIRRGRVIRGQPDAWRPYSIYGDARNDLINQRIVGEIHLDAFQISHTKDEILWQLDEEVLLDEYLEKQFAKYKQIATDRRKKGTAASAGPSDADVQVGLSELRQQLEGAEFADAIMLQAIPSDAMVQAAKAPLIQAAGQQEPAVTVKIDDTVCRVYLDWTASPNDPYFATEFSGNDVLVTVNARHPHFSRVGGAEGVANYLRDCVYDALAQWKCAKRHVVAHDTIMLLKDGLLRLDISSPNGG